MAQTGLRTLLIESDPLMADITGYRLELLGYHVSVAATAVEVWGTIDRALPHAIVLNLDSSELDGFGLLEKFSSDPRISEIPILALSADADLDRVERAWKDGARDYLVTPYDPQSLEQKVERLLADVEPQPELTREAPREASGEPSGEIAAEAPVERGETRLGMSREDERLVKVIDEGIPPIRNHPEDASNDCAEKDNSASTDRSWLN